MEKVFFVDDRDLKEVNKALTEGGKVKMISTVAQSVTGEYAAEGTVHAYIVVEMPDK